MWFARHRLFTKTSIWRFTLVFAAMVLAILCAILAVVYEFTVDEQKEQLEKRLVLATLGLTDLSNAPNVDEQDFKRIVEERSEKTTSLVLALTDDGDLVGNLSRVPEQLPQFPKTQQIPIVVTDYSAQPTVKTALGTRVDTRFGTLAIAMFDDGQQVLEQDFWTASALALGCALVLTLVAGFAFNWYVLARITQISKLAAEVKEGKLERRLPVGKRGDEYDRIATLINDMLNETDELLHSVASVTDNIAHDLRTPLSRLRINIEETLESGDLTEGEMQWRRDLLVELDQLIATFNAMLELTSLERGLSETELESCDLAIICEDVADLVAPLAEDKEQQFELVAGPALKILGDPDLLFRAIYNLAENAVKYTQRGGRVRLSLSGTQLIIEDNGPGIPVEESDRVFQRLYQLDKSRNDRGFGLGLSIVKAVVKMHRGTIRLEGNTPGLRVVIEFPESPQAAT